MTEDKISELFLTQEHVILLVGIFATIMLLKWVKPISKIIFSEKWKWLIAPINLLLSGLGIFVLGLTTFTTTGMKIIMLLVASTFVTFTYEAVLKYAIDYITRKIKEKLGKK
jgi:hypothetical protein